MGIFHSKFADAYRSVLLEQYEGRKNRPILPTIIFATSVALLAGAGAGAAAYYQNEVKKKTITPRLEGGWKFCRGLSSSGAHLGQHAVNLGKVRDECARVALIAAKADSREGVHAFDSAGLMYGHTENYPLLDGSVGNLLDGIFRRDAMVPPGWIAFPNTTILREKGGKTLHKLPDIFCMAHQAAEQGMLMFDSSGTTCKERLISCITYSNKIDKTTYVKYADRH